jgi:hypothetical protein
MITATVTNIDNKYSDKCIFIIIDINIPELKLQTNVTIENNGVVWMGGRSGTSVEDFYVNNHIVYGNTTITKDCIHIEHDCRHDISEVDVKFYINDLESLINSCVSLLKRLFVVANMDGIFNMTIDNLNMLLQSDDV